MTLDELMATLDGAAPPGGLRDELCALWHDARGDWTRAHTVVQHLESREAARVHAYLHRKEGDIDNARYWYRRAAVAEATGSLEDEWRAIATDLLVPNAQ
jgi:hypothetical protein